tara:strand:- start:174 stop:434 length:261 start_codon:yes stop_codon:yes gene_type:complete
MEPVTIKFEDNFLRDIEKIMIKHRYATKSEFIREAIREKVKDLEKEEVLRNVDRLFGSSKHKTTDEDLHKAGERAIQELMKERGIK